MTTLPLLSDPPLADLAVASPKEEALLALLAGSGRTIVAFSGGVDSTYLAWAAHQALGEEAVAYTAVSASMPERARGESAELAAAIGIAHVFIASDEVSDPRYLENAPDRCYWCKSELYTQLARVAAEHGFATIVDGTNRDDLGDFRPGRKAAAENSVHSPLVEAGLSKGEIRILSQRAGLNTWARPASPCLSSRIPHGTKIDPAMLRAVDRAEEAVAALGFREFRVRHHGAIARIEIAALELERALTPEVRANLARAVRAAGFTHVVVDTEPFRSGSMNGATLAG